MQSGGGPPGLKRSFLKIVVVPAVSLAFSGLAHVCVKAPEGLVARLLAPVIALFAVLFAARFVAHLELGYWEWTTPLHRVMCGLTIFEGLIALAFLMTGPYLFFRVGIPSAHRLSVLEFDSAGILLLVIMIQCLVVSWLAEELGLERGSENAKHCRIVKILKGGAQRLGLERLVKVCERTTPANHVSVLVMWTLASLCSVVLANSPSVAPTAYRYLEGESNADQGAGAQTPTPHSREYFGYPAHCGPPGAESDLGTAVPEELRAELYAQWFARGRGLGENFAGCINPAHEVGTTGVWVAAGTCEGIFRSLAVATPKGRGAILLWGPGRFAMEEAEAGTLLGATPHVFLGSGDMYSITTTWGTSIFLREELSDGNGGLKGKPRSCAAIKEDPVSFIRVPPALTRLWLSQMELEKHWLWPNLEPGQQSDDHFVFHDLDPNDTRRIVAHCETETGCVLETPSGTSSIIGAGAVDIERLMAFAPVAP